MINEKINKIIRLKQQRENLINANYLLNDFERNYYFDSSYFKLSELQKITDEEKEVSFSDLIQFLFDKFETSNNNEIERLEKEIKGYIKDQNRKK